MSIKDSSSSLSADPSRLIKALEYAIALVRRHGEVAAPFYQPIIGAHAEALAAAFLRLQTLEQENHKLRQRLGVLRITEVSEADTEAL